MTDPLAGAPWTVTAGDCRAVLATWPDACIDAICTSPPYFALRDYGHADQIGAERTLEAYIASLVAVFTAARRVLKPTGTLWLNLGDSYARDAGSRTGSCGHGTGQAAVYAGGGYPSARPVPPAGYGEKQLLGVPWRVAFALQASGWILRSAIPWVKRSAMPESTQDRPNSSLEYVFLFSRQPRYYFDMEAAKAYFGLDRNWRNGDALILDINTSGNPEAHFATWPPNLVRPMILAGSSARGCCAACGAPWGRVVEYGTVDNRKALKADAKGRAIYNKGGNQANSDCEARAVSTVGWQPSCRCDAGDPIPALVCDPFVGSGTTGMVARQLGRRFIGIDLNAEYATMARRRIGTADPEQAIPDRAGVDYGPLFATLPAGDPP